MPSINLLPENFTIEAYKKRERIAVYLLGVIMLTISTSLCAWAGVERQERSDESAVLDSEIATVKKEIKYNVESSNLLSSDYSKADITQMLKDHIYFSKALEFLKVMTVKDAYLDGMEISLKGDSGFEINLTIIAKNFDVMADQISVLRDSFWIKSFTQGAVESEEGEEAAVEVTLSVRKDLLIYHEQYFDYGLETLASECNRDVEISGYSVAIKTEKDKETGDKEEVVVVSFNGTAYDKDKLDEFEKKMNEKYDIVKDLKLNRSASADAKPGTISFTGSLVLKH